MSILGKYLFRYIGKGLFLQLVIKLKTTFFGLFTWCKILEQYIYQGQKRDWQLQERESKSVTGFGQEKAIKQPLFWPLLKQDRWFDRQNKIRFTTIQCHCQHFQ